MLYRTLKTPVVLKVEAKASRLLLILPALLTLLLASQQATSQAVEPTTSQIVMPSKPLVTVGTVTRVALGSCFKQQRGENEIWSSIAASDPDLFLYAGDTLYPEAENDEAGLPDLREAYARLAAFAPLATLRAQVPVLPIWDDHDYGQNDGGANFSRRATAEALFEEAWALPDYDPRRTREGVYYSVVFGAGSQRLQLILLDTRYFRSPLKITDKRGAPGRERYIPDLDTSKTMLGDAQWSWLEEQLQTPADLRLLVSTVQVLADGHGWEGWHQLPRERDRLFDLLRAYPRTPTLLLSGDRHVAGFYELDIGLETPLFEFTSSALNNTIPFPYRTKTLAENGVNRLAPLVGEANFGLIDIDWEKREVRLSIRNVGAESVLDKKRRF